MSDPVKIGLERILAPLREQVAKLDKEIETAEALLAGKREDRRRIERVLRAADPDAPRPGRKPKSSHDWEISQATADGILDYLKEHADRYNGEGFHATGLFRDRKAEGLRQPSDATVNKALRLLHQQGRIRLVRRGTGGSRIYGLV